MPNKVFKEFLGIKKNFQQQSNNKYPFKISTHETYIIHDVVHLKGSGFSTDAGWFSVCYWKS